MNRIFHTWEKWECYPAGFYDDKPKLNPERSKAQLERAYAGFLSDYAAFTAGLVRVLKEWPSSCEHYLSNENMNRLAWLGQAAACISLGIPSAYRSGYHLLSPENQRKADEDALIALNRWLADRGEPPIGSIEEAQSKTEMNLY